MACCGKCSNVSSEYRVRTLIRLNFENDSVSLSAPAAMLEDVDLAAHPHYWLMFMPLKSKANSHNELRFFVQANIAAECFSALNMDFTTLEVPSKQEIE